MENIKSKRILIGRNSTSGQLQIMVEGHPKTVSIGNPNSVPLSVSRCLPDRNMAHAELSIDNSGQMTLRNMKPQNVTYINGSEINSKRVDSSSVAELGREHYRVSIGTIAEAARKIIGESIQKPRPSAQPHPQQGAAKQEPPKRYNITHLERIWNEHHDANLRLTKRTRDLGLQARIPMIFTMPLGVLSALSYFFHWGDNLMFITGGLALIACIIFIGTLIRQKKDNSIEERERLQEEFCDKYICPNPECHRFLGNMSYKLLKRQYKMQCPYCRCEFFEK